MALFPDQRLDEFRIIRRLGAGGYGAVYLAQDTLLNRPVAVKELLAVGDDASIRQRFLQEAYTIGQLNHPNIVTIYRLLQKEAALYIVLEYVAGGSLRDYLNQAGKMDFLPAVHLAAEVCEALAVVHARGIVHRDIKPENILLTADGHAKVTDFGIAHVPVEAGGLGLTQTGAQMGTSLYMSPEQVRGEKLTSASDIYQVAAVLYELLAGKDYLGAEMLRAQAMRDLNVLNPAAPVVQGRWMLLVWQAILQGQLALKLDEHLEAQRLLEEVLLTPPPGRLGAEEFGRRLRRTLQTPPSTLTLTLAPGVDLALVRVPAGRFWMGSDRRKDKLAEPEEAPLHAVLLEDYYIGQYPVTNFQYQAFVSATGHRPPARWKQGRCPPGEEQCPVSHVAWEETVAFCRWASEALGLTVRLPTEAEWEKAARGPQGRRWPWGNRPPTAKHCPWDDGATVGYGPVGRYSPRGDSPYGCADQARNVCEWTSTLFRAYPYDPDDGREDPKSHARRVVRGGGGRLTANGANTRCAYRRGEASSSRNWFVGFRVVVAGPPLPEARPPTPVGDAHSQPTET